MTERTEKLPKNKFKKLRRTLSVLQFNYNVEIWSKRYLAIIFDWAVLSAEGQRV